MIADTAVNEWPNSEQMANIAISSARIARLFGMDPKVAFLSHSTFGQPTTERTSKVRGAVEILDNKQVDFKYDGEMQPDVALEENFKIVSIFRNCWKSKYFNYAWSAYMHLQFHLN